MLPQASRRLFAFVTVITVFSTLPQFASAQQFCPSGYVLQCNNGGKHCKCVKFWPYLCPRTGCGTYSEYSISVDQAPSVISSHLTTINFQLEDAGNVSLEIYDIEGRLIKTLIDDQRQQGPHQLEWDAKDQNGNKVSTGLYLLQVDAGNKSEIKKLLVTN
jgi:hypothetical protein